MPPFTENFSKSGGGFTLLSVSYRCNPYFIAKYAQKWEYKIAVLTFGSKLTGMPNPSSNGLTTFVKAQPVLGVTKISSQVGEAGLASSGPKQAMPSAVNLPNSSSCCLKKSKHAPSVCSGVVVETRISATISWKI